MKNIINLLCYVFLMGNQALCTLLSPSDLMSSASNYSLVRINPQSSVINHEHVSTLEDKTIKSLEPIFIKLNNTKADIIHQAPWALQGLYNIIYSFDPQDDNYLDKGNFSVNRYTILGLGQNTSRCCVSSSIKNPTVLFLQGDFAPHVSFISPKASCGRRSYPDDNVMLRVSFNDCPPRNRIEKQRRTGDTRMKHSKSDSSIYLHQDIESLKEARPYQSLRQPMDIKAICKGKSGTANVVNEIMLKLVKNNKTLKKVDIARLETVLLYGNYAYGLLLSADYYLFNFLALVNDRRYLLLFLVFNEYLLKNLFPEKTNRYAGLERVGPERRVSVNDLTSVLKNSGINNLVKTLVSELLPINNENDEAKKFNALINITKLPVLIEKGIIEKKTFLDMLEAYLTLYSIAFMKTRLSAAVLINKKYNTTNNTARYPRYLRNTGSDVPVTNVNHNRCHKGCRKKCGCVLL